MNNINDLYIDVHKKLLDDMHDLYIKKNADYGNSVHDTYEKYGLVSFLVRMEDKLNRVRNLNKDNVKISDAKVQDEKIEDTLMDLANYAILAIMELKREKSFFKTENVKYNTYQEEINNQDIIDSVKYFMDKENK
jgi:hypothetical protein